MQDWQRQDHLRRQQHLMTRGVTREHVELLPEDGTDPLPTPVVEDLANFRRQSLREELAARRKKARDAFQVPWLQSTERELHETTTKLLQVDLDGQTRASLEAYQDVLQEKLKNHHKNLGFNLHCAIALEERKRACVALGILRREQRDLVTTLFKTLPTVQELGETSGVAEKDRSSDEEALFITPVPSASGNGTLLRETNDCALSEAMLRESSTRKRKTPASSQPGHRKAQNTITNYFFQSKMISFKA